MASIGAPLTNIIATYDLLGAGLRSDPSKEALVSLERRWTFAELDACANRLARAYLGFGLKPGDRVASLMPNRGVLIVHYLACLRAGFVSVPLNYRYTSHQMRYALEKSGASLLVHHADRAEAAEVTTDPPLPRVVYGAKTPTELPRLEDLLNDGDGSADGLPPYPAPTAAALIMFTSGSTGPAKGVTHSHQSFAFVLGAVAMGLEMVEDDVVLPGSSISHLGGLMFTLAALSVGARAVVARSYVHQEILPLLRGERPTVLCMLPTALIRLVSDGHGQADDFSSLRLVRAGADKVPTELEHQFFDLTGIHIDEGYGMTECGLALLNPVRGPIIAGSVGRPIPGVEMEVRDDEGQVAPVGTDGNVFIRTPAIMSGYWADPEATAKTIVDGWLDSGDLMRVDADGNFWFRGRRKQIIVHDGSNIFPQEVEDSLISHPDVVVAGVVGIEDLVHGENVRAYVVCQPGATAKSADLIAFSRERIGYRAPEEVFFLEEMPLNPTGKVDRVTLKKMAGERH